MPKTLKGFVVANDIEDFNDPRGFSTRLFIGNSFRVEREHGWVVKNLILHGHMQVLGNAEASNLCLANIGGLACAYYADRGNWVLDGELFLANPTAMEILRIMHGAALGVHKAQNISVEVTKGTKIGNEYQAAIFIGPYIRARHEDKWPIYLRPMNEDGRQVSVCPATVAGSQARTEPYRIERTSVRSWDEEEMFGEDEADEREWDEDER